MENNLPHNKVLTFKWQKLAALLKRAHLRWKKEVRTLYQQTTGPGFWIVGDSGVYIMHNGKTTKAPKQKVVFAEECNPETMPFDEWWEAKNRTFGGDDGAEFLEKNLIEFHVSERQDLIIEFAPGEFIIHSVYFAKLNPDRLEHVQ